MGVLIRLTALPAATIVFWRAIFATATILTLVVVTGRSRELAVQKHRILLLLTGVLLLVSMVFFAKAVQLTTVANAILIVYTAPVLIAALAPIFLGERLERRTIPALALALTGIGLIVAPQGLALARGQLLGIGFASVTAVAYALLVLVGKRVVADVRARIMVFYQSIVAAVVLLPFVAGRPLPPTWRVWALLALLGAVHTALASLLYLSGLRSVTAQNAGILAYLEPLSGAVYGMIFLGEPLTVWLLAGGALIVAGGWLVIAARPPESSVLPR